MRLDFALSNAGEGSRREIRDMITRGKVSVNGKEVRDVAFPVAETDTVYLCGKKVDIRRYVYLMMNKPTGYVCTTDSNERNVFELVPENLYRKGLFCVGRLDKDTTGLLLLTNDGNFAHEIISPKKMCKKTYRVKLFYPVTDEDVSEFERGLVLANGEKLLPADIDRTDKANVVYITVCEGKYHQIKRMFASRGNKVIDLHRIRVGKYFLPEDLETGKCRLIETTFMEIIEKKS